MFADLPAWVVLLPSGRAVESGPGQSPTAALDCVPGAVLAFRAGPLRVMVAAGPKSRIEWLSTVDMKAGTGESVRHVGPAIVPGGGEAVRLWIGPGGDLVALADGPIEQVMAGLERIKQWQSRSRP